MSKINLYSVGKKATTLSLPAEYSEKPNQALIAQAVHVYRDHLHPKTARTKTRGEVDITGKKIYRQKGTGGARHGARSAPIFVGGGKAHGPKGIKRVISLPQKMRRKALVSALSAKAKEGRVAAANGITKLTKTKDAQSLIDSVVAGEKLTKNARILVAVSEKSLGSRHVFSNISGVTTVPYKNLNAHNVVLGGTLLIDADVFEKTKPAKEVKKTK